MNAASRSSACPGTGSGSRPPIPCGDHDRRSSGRRVPASPSPGRPVGHAGGCAMAPMGEHPWTDAGPFGDAPGIRADRGRRLSGERGSATVWMITVITVIWAVATAVVAAGMARVARHRAQSAADLSALAGAAWAFSRPALACTHAKEIADANGVVLESCAISEGIAEVAVSLRFTLPIAGARSVRATARAGPVTVQR